MMIHGVRETSANAQVVKPVVNAKVGPAQTPAFETLFQRAEVKRDAPERVKADSARDGRASAAVREADRSQRGERGERGDHGERTGRGDESDRSARDAQSDVDDAAGTRGSSSGERDATATKDRQMGIDDGGVDDGDTVGQEDQIDAADVNDQAGQAGQAGDAQDGESSAAVAAAQAQVINEAVTGDASAQGNDAAQAGVAGGSNARRGNSQTQAGGSATHGRANVVMNDVQTLQTTSGQDANAQGGTDGEDEGSLAGKAGQFAESAGSGKSQSGHVASRVGAAESAGQGAGVGAGPVVGAGAENGAVNGAQGGVQSTSVGGAQGGASGHAATLAGGAGQMLDVDGSGGDGDVNASRIARALTGAVRHQGGSVTIRMTPPELGTVRVELMVRQGTVSAQFHTEHDSVRQMLNQRLGQLHQALESQGLNVERLNVTSTQSGSGAGFQEDQGFGSPEDGRSRGQMEQGRRDGRGDNRNGGGGGAADPDGRADRFDRELVESAR